MQKKKFIPMFITIILAAVISIFTFSFIDSNSSDSMKTKVSADESAKTKTEEQNKKSGNSAVTNNVQNQITGEQADVNNTIDNQLKNSDNNNVQNNITNNIDVDVNVNVTNNVGNHMEGQKESQNDTSNQNPNQNQPAPNNPQPTPPQENPNQTSSAGQVVWGVDSASETTSDTLSCVRENYGNPKVWGRYLGEKEGVSTGLSPQEVQLLHSNNIKILPIWNHFTNATGYDNGKSEAQQAVQKAKELGIPEGKAIFADIEPSYPVDSEFIRGWFEVVSSSNYTPGIYGIFDAEKELYSAFTQAAQQNPDILAKTYIWTAAPNTGITAEAKAPQYQPEGPDGSLIGGWQYGIDSPSCNIDTNLFNDKVMEVLW